MKLSDRQKECIKSEFKKLNLPEKCYPLYLKHFSEWIFEIYENHKVDITGDPNVVSAEDEDFSAAYLLETTVEHCRDLINIYHMLLTQGYSESFAETYIKEEHNGSDEFQGICDKSFFSTVRKIGNSNTDLGNPAYREIFQVAKDSGHTDIYAHYLSSIIVGDTPLSKALKTAELYESAYNECIESGYSEAYSRIYAQEYSSDLRKDTKIAQVYARCYEIKIQEGLPHNNAWCFANDYVEVWMSHGDEPFIDDTFNAYLLPTAEAKQSYRPNEKYSEYEYVTLFEIDFNNIRHRENISICDALKHAHEYADKKLLSRKSVK
jgi:hypothetical protein